MVVGSAQASIEVTTSPVSMPVSAATSSTAGMSVSELQSLLSSLEAKLRALRAEARGSRASSPSSVAFVFTRDLQLHDTGTDVQMLQQFLNSKGFLVASQGPGSPGNETMIFGTHTWSALVAFQKSVGIVPAKGYFGPKTRAYVNAQKK
jgi:hypothetical protein